MGGSAAPDRGAKRAGGYLDPNVQNQLEEEDGFAETLGYRRGWAFYVRKYAHPPAVRRDSAVPSKTQ